MCKYNSFTCRCSIAACAEIDCFDECETVHINCSCQDVKKIPINKLEFLKKQRLRGLAEKPDFKQSTLSEIRERALEQFLRKKEKEKESFRKSIRCKIAKKRKLPMKNKNIKSSFHHGNLNKQNVPHDTKPKNLIYKQQFSKIKQNDQIEDVILFNEEIKDIYVQEEQDPLDVLESKVDIQDFDSNSNPSCEQHSRRKQHLLVKIEDKFNEHQHFE